ncbi:hypothetical protein K435DRAFT_793996 [Dendrothele bispora CBS 962.96]|uniref:Uncharacterized protein n=1 Tax=Dendrothele bispora (strain CBS 962.96) TaxID=1314807 RepID=A0A4V4HGY8_DENBC|nr:hypothetical protein K435DRAFT_793996 [Dendrothele bispora CBS 962.96]
MPRVRSRSEISESDYVLHEKVKLVPCVTMAQAHLIYDEDIEASLKDTVQRLELQQAINSDLMVELKENQKQLDEARQELEETRQRLEKRYLTVGQLRARITELQIDLEIAQARNVELVKTYTVDNSGRSRKNNGQARIEEAHGKEAIAVHSSDDSHGEGQIQIEGEKVVSTSVNSESKTRDVPTSNDSDTEKNSVKGSQVQDQIKQVRRAEDVRIASVDSNESETADPDDSDNSSISDSEASKLRDTAAIVSYGLLTYPADAIGKTWFQKAFSYLNVDLGLHYQQLLLKWIDLERHYGWNSGEQKVISTEFRPVEVQLWIKDGRYVHLLHTWVRAEEIEGFAERFWKWWNLLQPEWRLRSDLTTRPAPFSLTESTGIDASWNVLNVCGQNGWLSLLTCIKWWGVGLQYQGADRIPELKRDWEAAVDDMARVLDAVLRLPLRLPIFNASPAHAASTRSGCLIKHCRPTLKRSLPQLGANGRMNTHRLFSLIPGHDDYRTTGRSTTTHTYAVLEQTLRQLGVTALVIAGGQPAHRLTEDFLSLAFSRTIRTQTIFFLAKNADFSYSSSLEATYVELKTEYSGT